MPAISEREREAIAVLVSVHRLGPVSLEQLVAACGSAEAVLDLAGGPNAAARLIGATALTADSNSDRRPIPDTLAEAIVEAAARRAAITDRIRELELRVLVSSDADYPARLRTIELPPAALFVRGDASVLNPGSAVAVVGTRRPTEAGRRTASRIGTALARAEAVVVSGLALGIDGVAHAAVVEAGGRTVAYIGGGHARLFPFVHDRLAEAIVAGGGAIVSEYAPDIEPTKGTFPRRNRLISGSADAVVVIEAGARSGALLTASWALEQGRDCYLVPGSIDAPMSAGCLGFLRDWPGEARIVAGIPQLLDDLGLAAAAALPRPAAPQRGPSALARPGTPGAAVMTVADIDEPIASAVSRGAATVDELVAITHQTVPAVLAGLTRLETAGLVATAFGRYGAIGPLASGETRASPPASAGPSLRASTRPSSRAATPPAA